MGVAEVATQHEDEDKGENFIQNRSEQQRGAQSYMALPDGCWFFFFFFSVFSVRGSSFSL